jgi:hypothetical protein
MWGRHQPLWVQLIFITICVVVAVLSQKVFQDRIVMHIASKWFASQKQTGKCETSHSKSTDTFDENQEVKHGAVPA